MIELRHALHAEVVQHLQHKDDIARGNLSASVLLGPDRGRQHKSKIEQESRRVVKAVRIAGPPSRD